MTNKHITFLSFFHSAFDERIWYHQRQTLLVQGYDVSIISGIPHSSAHKKDSNVFIFDCKNLSISDRIKTVRPILEQFKPDIIICDTPEAIIAALKYKKLFPVKILYDITERYPSFVSLSHKSTLTRPFYKFIMKSVNMFSAAHCDGFIFGEYYKSLPFIKSFPKTPHINLSYYPDIKYITPQEPKNISHECRLFYSGSTSAEKGFDNIINSAVSVANMCSDTQFILNVITNEPLQNNNLPNNLSITYSPYVSFTEFCNIISENDIFFDLRVVNNESIYSLPIKLFYFMACGRPSIYFKNKAIIQHMGIKNDYCHLVNPIDYEQIATIIKRYIDNPAIYKEHCKSALYDAENKYNWGLIKTDFSNFISEF